MDLFTIIVILVIVALPLLWFRYSEKILNFIGVDTDDMIHFQDDNRK